MKTPLLYFVVIVLALAGPVAAQDLTGNNFFKTVEGKWKGAGKVTNGAQETFDATNNIEAGFSADGNMFSIKGSLKLGAAGEAGEVTPIEYRWEYVKGAIEGLLAGRFVNLSAAGEASDFEVSIDEENLIAKLSQISGASGEPRIEMTNKVVEGQYIVSFTMTDSNGQTVLNGELKFDREE